MSGQIQFQRGNMITFRIMRSFNLGSTKGEGRDLHVGNDIDFDGQTCEYGGDRWSGGNLKAAIRQGWLVPVDPASGLPVGRGQQGPISANIQVGPAQNEATTQVHMHPSSTRRGLNQQGMPTVNHDEAVVNTHSQFAQHRDLTHQAADAQNSAQAQYVAQQRAAFQQQQGAYSQLPQHQAQMQQTLQPQQPQDPFAAGVMSQQSQQVQQSRGMQIIQADAQDGVVVRKLATPAKQSAKMDKVSSNAAQAYSDAAARAATHNIASTARQNRTVQDEGIEFDGEGEFRQVVRTNVPPLPMYVKEASLIPNSHGQVSANVSPPSQQFQQFQQFQPQSAPQNTWSPSDPAINSKVSFGAGSSTVGGAEEGQVVRHVGPSTGLNPMAPETPRVHTPLQNPREAEARVYQDEIARLQAELAAVKSAAQAPQTDTEALPEDAAAASQLVAESIQEVQEEPSPEGSEWVPPEEPAPEAAAEADAEDIELTEEDQPPSDGRQRLAMASMIVPDLKWSFQGKAADRAKRAKERYGDSPLHLRAIYAAETDKVKSVLSSLMPEMFSE